MADLESQLRPARPGIEELSAISLGGVSLGSLHAAGRITEVSPGAVTLAATAFRWPVTSWCPDEF